ncbi:MAG: sulfatase-like hydrolase/transferase, partial [Flavitalea sp.]
GTSVEKNWNGEIKPGPNEVGFDYSFIFPATADRVPTVFVEDHSVIALDQNDLIEVNYKQKVGNEPTGKENPDLLKLRSSPDHGHDNTIVNGIGRIGYMKGGKTARWTDEEMPLTFLTKAKEYIEKNRQQPFFLYYSLTEPHVPRMPSTMFKDKSGMGFRGDAILQLDWAVGEIMKQLELLGISKNTMIIFSSDNGPVVDDGYMDDAVARLNGHKPAGVLRGGKYSIFEGGTRVPFIVSWPASIKAGTSGAMLSQIDLLRSFAKLLDQKLPANDADDSEDHSQALIGRSKSGRVNLIEHAGTLAIISGDWKYIAPSDGEAFEKLTATELGNDPQPQLYNLKDDPGEKNNLAAKNAAKLNELKTLLERARGW